VYIVFERGEQAHGVDRIVRIGTNTGKRTLASRIREHVYKQDKDRSIFRKHIGRAFLNMTKRRDPFLTQWNIDLTSKKAREKHGAKVNKIKLSKVEAKVTRHIMKHVSLAVLPIKADWVSCERRLLSTIFACKECGASETWLGKSHPDTVISEGGLWNVQDLNGPVLTLREAKKLI
jgi:hypothetical protein